MNHASLITVIVNHKKEWPSNIIWLLISVFILASVHSNVIFVQNGLARRVLVKIISKHTLAKNVLSVQFAMLDSQGRDNFEFIRKSGMMVLDIVKLKGKDWKPISKIRLLDIKILALFWIQKSKTKTSSLEEIAETMVTSLQPSLLPTKEQIRSLGIDDNELLRTLREGLNQSETANLTSIDTTGTKTPIMSTNHNEEPQVEEINNIPNSFELFMWFN